MKKETGKKSKLWIVLVALLVLLLAAGGVVLALFLGGQNAVDPGPAESPLRAELYWNVDRVQYTENSETGLSTRVAAEDGQFHIRFAYNGELVDLIAADKKIVNIIDTQDVMGLEFDADGRIIGTIQPLTLATEVGKRVYVQYAEGDTIVTNSSLAMNGMEMPIRVSELTGIYEVDPANERLGQALKPEDLKPFDCVTIYANANGDNTHVYVVSHSVSSKMYFRCEQWYDSTKQVTTRTPDENGVYSIDFFCDGERITLQTKDADLLRKIDSLDRHVAYTGLTFDDNGYFDGVMEVSVGLGGLRNVYRMEVDSVDGRTAYLKNVYNSNGPTEQTITIPESTPIYDMSTTAEAEGRQGKEVEMVQPGDRITMWSDMQGNPIMTIITLRRVDMKPYYSPSRKYNSTTHQTTRVRGDDGYFTINLVAEGEGQQTYKILDEKVAQFIDRYAERTVGIVKQGDVIIRAYDYEAIFGYNRWCTALWVDSINGSIIGASDGPGNNSYNVMMSPDCKVIDVTDTTTPGAHTDLKVGDRIIAFRNPQKEVCLIWTAGRTFEDSDFYVNVTRKYDNTKKETTRETDENGYYVFEMANRGKAVTIRTKSKALATKIDSYGVRVMGMYVSGDIAQQAFYGGHVTGGWIDLYNGVVTEVLNDKEIRYHNEGKPEEEFIYKMIENYECYNIGTAVYSHVGERTSPRVGDRIMIYNNRADEGVALFVLRREPHNGLYWNKTPMFDVVKQETSRKPDANGYYVFEMSYLGKSVTLKTKDKKIANTLDSNNYGVVLTLDGSIIRSVSSHTYAKDIETLKYGAWDVTSVSGGRVNLRFNRYADAYGKTATFYLSGTRIYDVSPMASVFGQATSLKAGDRVRVYTDEYDRVTYVYIVCRNSTRYQYCDHCGKEVQWSAWTGSNFDVYSGHHFLPCDRTIYTQYVCGSKDYKFEAVFDLNGHTLTRNGGGRMLVPIYGDTLTILDSVGGGTIQGMGGENVMGSTILATEGATFNLLSGTLKNIGNEEIAPTRGGVLYAYGDDTTINMYGGEIVGGKMLPTEKYESTFGSMYIYKSTFNLYDGKIYGGEATLGGNIYLADKATFNMYGGLVTGGVAEKNGGNVYASSNTTTNLVGGLITDGVSGNVGGNYFATTNSVITISGEVKDDEYVGAIIANGTAVPQVDPETGELKSTYGGNVYLDNAIMNVNGGALVGGNATRGGNVNVGGTKSELNINGGFLLEGIAGEGGTSGQGGNIRVASACVINLNGGVIADGTSTNTGGNIFMGFGAVLNVTNGGEIYGGGKPAEGQSTTCNYGGNIYAYGGDCQINITDSKVYGGYSRGRTANICLATASEVGAKLNLVNAELDGCVQVSKASSITVSGATKISGVNGGLDLRSGTLMVMNELTEGAEICVNADGAFTVENKNAAKYLESGFVKGATEYITITEQDDVLYATQPDASRYNDVYEKAVAMTANETFKSGELVYAQCPYCEVEAAWEPLPVLDGEEKFIMNTSAHYYLAEGVNYESALDNVYYWMENKAAVCLHLNGQSINNSGESAFTVRQGCVLTVMGDGTIQGLGGGEHKNFNGGAFDLLAGTVNLCGGTYMTTGATPIIATRGNTATLVSTINIFNGTKVQGDEDNTISSLYLFGAVNVNMYGGLIADGIGEGNYGGNVYMSNTYPTVFNLYGGTVSGGTSNQGGNFRVAGKLNVYGGTIEAGVTTNTGGNVFLLGDSILNMEGGSIQNGQAPNGSGGNIYSYGKNTIQMSGDATITGGTAKNGGGKNIYTINADGEGTKLIMNGGSIENSVYVSTLSSVELSGAPKIGNGNGALYMGADAENASKITLGELTEGTEVYVTASGVFTQVNPKAADYLAAGYFKPAVASSKIQEQDGVLFIDNGDKNELCPVCGESVTWKILPKLGASKQVINQSGHYFLAEDVNYDSSAYADSFYEIDGRATVCLNLNGQTITSGNRTFFGRIGTTLNVIGEGTVQGAGAGEHKNFNGGAFDMLGATVNLYGGTYKTTGATPIISTRSEYESTLNIYDGAVIQGAPTNTISSLYLYGAATVNMYGGEIKDGVATGNFGGNVYMADKYAYEFNLMGGTVSGGTSNQGGNFRIAGTGVLNVTGGTITGGTSTGNGGNVFLFGGATMNMEGGEITNGAANGGSGGNVFVYGAGTVKMSGKASISGATSKNGGGKNVYFYAVGEEISNFQMDGGSVANSVFINANTKTQLSGAPTIGAANGGLYILEGTKLTLGELTEGAEIYVTATGAFTEANEKAADYAAAGYFKSAAAKSTIYAEDGVLYCAELSAQEIYEGAYEKAKEMSEKDVFASNGDVKALCPVCYTTATWKPLPALGDEKLIIKESGHYYLASNVDYDSQINDETFYEIDGKATICLHLNEQTVNSGNRVFAVRQNCVMNVMGDGTLQGAGAGEHKNFNGGAFDLLQGTVNLCGGTYKTTGATPIISTRGANAEMISYINIYDGTIQGAPTNTISSLYLYGAAVVNMYGGEIKDGAATGNYGGNVYMADKYAYEFNLMGGTVSGGTSDQGGNFFVTDKAVVNLLGGTVSGGSAVQGGNIRVNGGTVNVKGATVSGGTATTNNGGNVFLMGGATLNVESGSIKDGAAPANNGGNIFAYGAATVKLSGDATVSGGTSKNGGGKNIYFLKLNDEVSTFVMNGGTVHSSVVVSVNTTTQLSGAPKIGAANGGLYIVDGAKLTLGELTEGTEIFVTANGAFTEANDKAADYLAAGYFKGATSKITITESEGVLSAKTMSAADIMAEACEAAKKMTENGTFASNGEVQAQCPVCYETVTWKPLPALGAEVLVINENCHYYLASNVNYDSTANTSAFYELRDKAAICLHLNGQTVNSGNRAFSVRQECTMKVMGEGTVKGAGQGTGTGGAFDLLGGNLTLCGGTYETTGASPVIGTRGVAGVPLATINIYNGSTIQGATTNTVSNLYLAGETTVNMYGGTITGGTATTVNGGNVFMGESFTETFNLYGGTVSGGTATQGGNFYVGKTGTVLVDGGTVENGVATSQGGNFRVSAGTVKIQSGSVTGGEATNNNGGNIFMVSGATLEMTGGSLTNGNAPSTASGSGNGGNIYSYGGNTVKLSGNATISGGTSRNNGGKNLYCVNYNGVGATVVMNGGTIDGGIYLSSKSAIEVAGAAKVGKAYGALYLSKGTLVTLGELTDGAEIYVTLEDAAAAFTVANEKAADYAKYFKTDIVGRRIIAKADNALYITTASEEAVLMTEEKVFESGEKVTAFCPICKENAEWNPVTSDTVLNTTNFATGNHFYLASDVQLTAGGNIKTDTTIAKACLHLNGKSFKQAATASNTIGAVWVVADTELTIMGEGTVVGAGYKVSDTRYLGGAIDARGIVNIYGGTYMSCSSLGRPAVTTMTKGAINMYAGTIARNPDLTVSELMSGNVWLDTDASANTTFNMYGGTITGGSALKGGNVYMTRGEFTMYGGTIEKGVATGTDDKSGHGAGNVLIAGGTFTLKNGVITGGTATVQGGNIRVDGGKFVMEGGTVSYGEAANLGGNIRIGGSATTAEIKGGQILGGYVPSSGGSIGVVGATVTISGGTIDGSGITQAANGKTGGLIYINSGNVTVSGTAVLKNGVASGSGNGIYVNADKTLVVSGGTVESKIYLTATSAIQLSGAPKLSDVDIIKGAKLTLGELTEGAEIFVTAAENAVVAELASDPTAYLTYIKSAVSTLQIAVDGTNLKAVAVSAG